MSVYSSHEISGSLIAVASRHGRSLCNLKLQKLLYYAQGFHLAIHGEPLFGDSIHRWKHGPVVVPAWRRFRPFGRTPIEVEAASDVPDLPAETSEILEAIWSNYGRMAAWALRELTHREPPWVDTPANEEIPTAKMAEFFGSVVKAGVSGEQVDQEPIWPTNSLRFQRRREIMGSRAIQRTDRLRDILARVPSNDPWLDDRYD